jgi:uncharacterized protein (DUF58 family)
MLTLTNKKETDKIRVNMFDFDTLVKQTIVTSTKLMEYFRMNIIYYQLISGKGLEFDRIKEYVAGHDPKRIDWKKFAKTKKLYIRAFKEERRFNVIVVIDVSDSMLLGTTNSTKNEFAAVIAGALGFAATESGDLIATTMFSDSVGIALDPSYDFYRMLNVISNKRYYGGKKDWLNLSSTLISNYDEESVVFIISDFIDTNAEDFLPELAAYFSKVYGIMLRDPIDDVLPSGVGRMYLKGTVDPKTYLVNLDNSKEDYRILNLRNADKVRAVFHKYNQLFFKIRTNEDFGTGFIKALGEEEVVIS